MIQAEVMRAKFLGAVLTAILVPQKNIPAVELNQVARNTVVIQQPDDARNLDREGDRAYPVIPLANIVESTLRFAQLQPTLKVEGHVLTLFDMHDFGLSLVEERKSALHIDNVDGGVGSIKSQHTGLHRRRWTRSCDRIVCRTCCNHGTIHRMEAGTVESRFPSGAESSGHFLSGQLREVKFLPRAEAALHERAAIGHWLSVVDQ